MKILDDARELLAPLLDEQRRKRRAADEKQRPALAQELRELERQEAARAPSLARDLETADAKLVRAKAEREAAQTEWDAAFHALTGYSDEVQRRRSKLEALLRETADPAIAAAREKLEAEIERTRHQSPGTVEVLDVDRAFDKKVTTVYSAIGHIRRRLEAQFAMRGELGKLELEVDADVPARLAELWAGIPAIGPTEMFRRTKPEFVK